MKTFYGLYGANGLAVYNSWEKVERNRKFLKSCQLKKFTDFIAAQEYVVANFLAFNSPVLAEVLPKTLPMNYMLFRKQLCNDYDQLYAKKEDEEE